MQTALLGVGPGVRARVAGLVVVLALAGCSAPGQPSGPAAGNGPARAGDDTAFTRADAMFLGGMTPHHEGAVEMARSAQGRAADPRIRSLAEQILQAQGSELALMERTAQRWGVDLGAGMAGMAGMGGRAGMQGDDVRVLTGLSGRAFDREFLIRMTAHHEAAVRMAQLQLRNGQAPEALELARRVVAEQTAEIARMQDLLRSL